MNEVLSFKLGERFVFVTLLPNLLFTLVIGFVIAAGAPGRRPSWSTAVASATAMTWWGWAILAAVVVVVSLAIHPLYHPLVQLVEGYWLGLPFGQVLTLAVTQRVNRRATELGDLLDADDTPPHVRSAAQERLRWLPDEPHKLRPTALGNALYAGEVLAGDRYGFQTLVVWRRLRPLLSEAVRSQVNDARNQLDASVRFCVLSVLAAVICTPLLFRYDSWLLLAFGCYLFGWASYRAAVVAAKRFCGELAVAFDLHHLELWDGLSLRRPRHMLEERDRAGRLCEQLQGDHPLSNQEYAAFVYVDRGGSPAPRRPRLRAR
jgi:hypothetical protein